VDYCFANPTEDTYRVRVWVTDEELRGEIRATRMPRWSYHLDESEHRFVRRAGKVRRQNTLTRRVVDRRTGDTVQRELVARNDVPVLYEVDPALIS
jgi:vancomycin resistance protein VanW